MLLPTFFTTRINCDISKTVKTAFEKNRQNIVIEDAGMTIGEMLKKLNSMRPNIGKKLSMAEYKELKTINKAFRKLVSRYQQ